MTSELEYSYLNSDFALKVSEDLLTRAVRVKQAVKEKLGRIYSKNHISEEAVQQSAPVTEVPVVEQKSDETQVEANGLESLIDLSEDNVAELDSKITALQSQNGISHVVRRAVLFTGALKDKISRVTSKWFENIEKEDRTEILPKVEYTNHLGGEVVPGTWDDKVEEKEEAVTPQFEVPSFSVESQAEEPQEEKPADFVSEPQTIPMTGLDAVTEPQIEAPVVPTIEPVSESQAEAPAVEPTESVSKVEETTPTVETSSTAAQSIEEKIAAILNRKNEVVKTSEPSEVAKVSEESASEEADREMVSSGPQLANKTDVVARLHRIRNTLQDKDAQIEKLSSKLSDTTTALDEARAKISGYETVLDDLTVKCNSLTQANEQLSSKNADMESSYSTKISGLEAQLSELKKSKSDEAETSKSAIAELKAKHAQEIEELKARHAKEIHDMEASKDKQINAIYATISEALGEPSYTDSENPKTM